MERTSSVGWAAELRLRGLPLRSQAVRGDAAALASVYERHHQALYRYCRSILHDDDEARDALQSTMAKALAALRDEERDFELRPWLFRIAHNEAISLVRRRREVANLDAVDAASTDSLAQAVEDRERLAHLRADLQDLPERQRAALVLRELSGLSHEEIAGVLETTARAVKQTIFEARVALQECAEGRAMVCADVQRALSDGDGRVLRGRRMRAHVRSCRSCRQFKAALAQRPADLAALAPALPATAGAAVLGHLLPGAKAGLASSAGTATGLGGGAAATLATKAAIVVAATATLAGTTTVVTKVADPFHDTVRAPSTSAPAPRQHPAPASAAPAGLSVGPPAVRQREAARPSSGHPATGQGGSAQPSARGVEKAKAGHAGATGASHAARKPSGVKAQPARGARGPAKIHRSRPTHPSPARRTAGTGKSASSAHATGTPHSSSASHAAGGSVAAIGGGAAGAKGAPDALPAAAADGGRSQSAK